MDTLRRDYRGVELRYDDYWRWRDNPPLRQQAARDVLEYTRLMRQRLVGAGLKAP
jgi:hypothetical protein